MSEDSEHLFAEAITGNQKIIFPVEVAGKSRIVGKLRYYWCWIAAGGLLLVVGAPSVAFLWIIRRRSWLYPVALWGARAWLAACGARVAVSGTEDLDPNKQYVFISNHRSYLDTATLFRYTGKRMGLVAKKEVLKAPVLGQGMSFVNVIAIDRSNPEKARSSMEKARQVMENGYSFGVFAEGTRGMPGELLPFKKGAFHLALQTGADIVPVAVKNTDAMMGKRTGVAYAGVIEMILLPAISTRDAEANDVMRLLTASREAIARELAKPTASTEPRLPR